MSIIYQVIGDHGDFLDKVVANLESVGINIEGMNIDHIAFRATSDRSYQEISLNMLKYGERASRVFFRNRNVDMYLLFESLIYNGQKIKYFEILAPAIGDKFDNGLEHAEFTIKKDLREFIEKHPSLDWNTNAIEREIGADVGIRFENGANSKFKNMAMDEIIRLENELI